LKQGVEHERLFLTGRGHRIAENIETIFLRGLLRRGPARDRPANR
jgi:hypothetical protein